jgi:hypothetical protein
MNQNTVIWPWVSKLESLGCVWPGQGSDLPSYPLLERRPRDVLGTPWKKFPSFTPSIACQAWKDQVSKDIDFVPETLGAAGDAGRWQRWGLGVYQRPQGGNSRALNTLRSTGLLSIRPNAAAQAMCWGSQPQSRKAARWLREKPVMLEWVRVHVRPYDISDILSRLLKLA